MDGTTTATSPYSVARPGGFQVAHGEAQGSGANRRSSGIRRLRQFYDPDYAVVFGKTSSNGDFTVDFGLQLDF